MATWQDFLDVAMNEASGNVSILDAPTTSWGCGSGPTTSTG